MTISNSGPVAANSPQEAAPEQVTADLGARGPMPQQDADGAHDNEMHLQKFVRLVGCHDSNAGKHELVQRQRRLH